MLLIDAIIGRGFPNDQVGADMARAGIALAAYHSAHSADAPRWVWNKTALKDMSLDDLDMVYVELLYRGSTPQESHTTA
jgi:hypothetical protein